MHWYIKDDCNAMNSQLDATWERYVDSKTISDTCYSRRSATGIMIILLHVRSNLTRYQRLLCSPNDADVSHDVDQHSTLCQARNLHIVCNIPGRWQTNNDAQQLGSPSRQRVSRLIKRIKVAECQLSGTRCLFSLYYPCIGLHWPDQISMSRPLANLILHSA